MVSTYIMSKSANQQRHCNPQKRLFCRFKTQAEPATKRGETFSACEISGNEKEKSKVQQISQNIANRPPPPGMKRHKEHIRCAEPRTENKAPRQHHSQTFPPVTC